MIYILMGLISAMFFGIGAFTVYGYAGLVGNPWVDYVFWWLIGTGVLLALVENSGRARALLRRWQESRPGTGEAVASH